MRIIRCTPVYGQFVDIGASADMFHSFAMCRGKLLCAFRRHVLVDMYGGVDFAANYASEIWMRRFDLTAGTWEADAAWLCQPAGEDPRLIVVRDRPYILSAVPPGQDANYILYDVDAAEARNIEVVGWTRPQYGKNWQPFVVDGELYAVHGFNPFRVLHIDIATGRARICFERAVGLSEMTGHDHYTRYRGGGAAIVRDGVVRGWGHATVDTGQHFPFGWNFSLDTGRFHIDLDFDMKTFQKCGHNIVDPTGLFAWDGRQFMGVTCSSRDWFYGQNFASYLCEVELDWSATPIKLSSDATHLLAREQAAGPTCWYFRASALPCDVGQAEANFERIARMDRDPQGYLAFGPYIDLPPGRYEVALQLASPAQPDIVVGWWDVCTEYGQRILGDGQIMGSRGALAVLRGTFDIAAPLARKIEVRVRYDAVADLRLTDITIRCRQDAATALASPPL